MKNKLKSFFVLIFAVLLCFGGMATLSACKTEDDEKIDIVCTIFPIYDWAKEIVGENNKNVNLKLLIDNGTDMHSYEPTFADIASISTADVFIYVGGESDEKLENALLNATNKNMVVINLLDVLGDKAKEEEIKEGMEGEEDHDHEDEHEEEIEYDEHVWLSLKNAKIFVNEFAKTFADIDADNKQQYLSNATDYISNLNQLDDEYTTALSTANTKTLLFADRFPFRYLVDDYDLNYYAAFIGCSAETEAKFETITFLANKIDELNLKAILKIETSDNSLANTVKNATISKDQTILTLDSLQNTTTKSKKTYLSVMTNNLEILKQATH